MDIPKNVVSKVFKSICKITFEYNDNDNDKMNCNVTGFFITINKSKKYLITYCHFMQRKQIKNIIIEIWNQEKMNLSLNDRFIEYLNESKDIIIIEIKNKDIIYNDIEFLNCDNNKNNTYYKNQNIFIILNIKGEETCVKGKILDIHENKFIHNIKPYNCCSGCPIIFWNENINEIQVIGIYTKGDFIYNDLNLAIFIDKIIRDIKAINKDLNNETYLDNDKILNDKINNISPHNNDININSIENTISQTSNNNQVKDNEKNIIEKKLILSDSKNAIVLKFYSVDQSLKYSVKCERTDIFNTIVNQIFEREPQCKDFNFYFICNGRAILIFKDIKGNNLKDGDTIILNTFE